MKKLTVFFLVLLLVLPLVSCERSSTYDQLSATQKAIVDTILQNQHQFSDCNGIKISYYNGNFYFRADYTKWSNHSNNPFGGVGRVEKTLLYVVKNGTFSLVSNPDAYTNANTTYGLGASNWDSSWSLEEKREILASIIEKY